MPEPVLSTRSVSEDTDPATVGDPDQPLIDAIAAQADDLSQIPAERRLDAAWTRLVVKLLGPELGEIKRMKAWASLCEAMLGAAWARRSVDVAEGCRKAETALEVRMREITNAHYLEWREAYIAALPVGGEDAEYFEWRVAEQKRYSERLAAMILALHGREEERVVSEIVEYHKHVAQRRVSHGNWARQGDSLGRALRFQVTRAVNASTNRGRRDARPQGRRAGAGTRRSQSKDPDSTSDGDGDPAGVPQHQLGEAVFAGEWAGLTGLQRVHQVALRELRSAEEWSVCGSIFHRRGEMLGVAEGWSE